MNNFRQNLKALMENNGLSVVALAKMVGVSRQTIGFWLRGETYPHGDNLERLATALNISYKELLFGDTEDVKAFVPNEDKPPVGYVCVPEFRMKAAAGIGISNDFEEIMDATPTYYRLNFFTSRGVKPESCKRIKVHGNSMEPFIYDGDVVLFSFDNPLTLGDVRDGCIYVLCVNGALKVKRLATTRDGLTLMSDNKTMYPDETFKNEDLNQITIFGKVLEVTRTCA